MASEALLRLRDMLACIDGVAAMLRGYSISNFRADLKTTRAVERCIEIVSEAWRRVPGELQALHPTPHSAEIISIGTLMRHDYRRIDQNTIWRIATRSLPDMRDVVVDLIARAEQIEMEQSQE